MTLGDIIKEYRVSHGLSQDVIAERSGLSKAYISILERNRNPKTGEPPVASPKTINSIATAINSDFDSIFSKLDPDLKVSIGEQLPQVKSASLPPNATPLDIQTMHRIPILGRISAGLPLYAEQNIEGYTLTDLNGGAEYFALRVSGDSMNAARIEDGDIIVVRRQSEVENGELAVVMVGDDDATVKRFYSTSSTVTLMPQSTNPEHQPQIYDLKKTKIKVLGKVVKIEVVAK